MFYLFVHHVLLCGERLECSYTSRCVRSVLFLRYWSFSYEVFVSVEKDVRSCDL